MRIVHVVWPPSSRCAPQLHTGELCFHRLQPLDQVQLHKRAEQPQEQLSRRGDVAAFDFIQPGGRGRGGDWLDVAGGEEVEVFQIQRAVVVEITLGEVAGRLAEVGGQDVEVEQVAGAVAVRVAVEKEELVRDVGGQRVVGGVGDAGGDQCCAVRAVGECAGCVAGEREVYRVGRVVVRER